MRAHSAVLGERAQAMGLSCNGCHPNGAAHTGLSIEGISDRPGNVDLSTDTFHASAADGVDNPVNIPSLRGVRYTAPYGVDGRVASLQTFVRLVVTREFGGEPLPDHELSALGTPRGAGWNKTRSRPPPPRREAPRA